MESDRILSDKILGKNYDVVVVGTGPGGGSAAIAAAEAGLRTLVVDRKPEVGVPIRCGEAVSEDVVLDRGIKLGDGDVRNYVNAGMFQSSSGRKIEVSTKNHGLILNRTRFEQGLIERAEAAGAVVGMRMDITGLSKKGVKIGDAIVKCKFVIGADGIDSVIGYRAGLKTTLAPRDIGVCAQYVVSNFEMQNNRVEMHWGEKFTGGGGYAWVFPRGDGSANVGLGLPGTKVPKDGMKTVLDRFLKIRCEKGFKKSGLQIGSIPQAPPMETAVKDNVILVGDAAHFTIPLTGSGIGHALFSGKAAVDTIAAMLDLGHGLEYLKTYDDIWKKKFSKKLRRAYRIKEKFREEPGSIDRFFKMLKPIAVLHRMFPNFIEKTALRDFRY